MTLLQLTPISKNFMMKTFKILFLSSFVLMTNLAFAQSYVGQISNASTIYNPSFVGSKNDLRIGIGNNYRNYINYYGYDINNNSFLSLDAPIKKISAGIGASITYNTMRDNSSSYLNLKDYSDPAFRQTYSNESNSINLDLTYAQIFTIRNKEREEIISIRPALSLNYNKNDFTYRENAIYDLNYQIKEINTSVIRVTPSVLITGKKYFIGAKYQSSLLSGCRDNNMGIKNLPEYYYFNVIGGYTFQRKPESKFSFTPILALQFDKYFTERNKRTSIGRSPAIIDLLDDINLTFKYGKFLTGFNLNCLMLGYQTEKLRVCLSFVPTTNLAWGELSLNYIFKKDKR